LWRRGAIHAADRVKRKFQRKPNSPQANVMPQPESLYQPKRQQGAQLTNAQQIQQA